MTQCEAPSKRTVGQAIRLNISGEMNISVWHLTPGPDAEDQYSFWPDLIDQIEKGLLCVSVHLP
jgi:hypothetical protein